MSKVILCENALDPSTWTTHNDIDDVPLFLFEHFDGQWPDTAHIFLDHVSTHSDITPYDAAGVERLKKTKGDFFIVVYPEGIETIFLIVAVVVAAVAVGLSFLLRPQLPSVKSQNGDSANNQLSDRQNTARPNQRIPDIFGQLWATPDLIAVPYRVFIGIDEYEYSYMCLGRGAYDILMVREDVTDVTTITGYSVEVYGPYTSPNNATLPVWRTGPIINTLINNLQAFSAVNGQILLAPNDPTVVGGTSGNWSQLFVLLYPETTEIWCNFVCPQGAYKIDSAGTQFAAQIDIDVEYQACDPTGAPIGVTTTQTQHLTGSTSDKQQKGMTMKIVLPVGYALFGGILIRAHRTSNEDHSPGVQTSSQIQWRELYFISPLVQTDFGNVTTIQTVVKPTTAALAIKQRKLNALVTRQIPTYLNAPGGTPLPLPPPTGAVDDLMQWWLMANRTTQHLSGTLSNYCWLDIDNLKFWRVKGSTGHPWDIHTYGPIDPLGPYHGIATGDWIQFWITENDLDFLNSSAYRRKLNMQPLFPRLFDTTGPAVTILLPHPNDGLRTSACETDSPGAIHLGDVKGITNPPVLHFFGGDVGNQLSIVCDYYYSGNAGLYLNRERFWLVKDLGVVLWENQVWNGSAYATTQSSLNSTIANGGCPTPVFPCSTVIAGWLGGPAPLAGQNVLGLPGGGGGIGGGTTYYPIQTGTGLQITTNVSTLSSSISEIGNLVTVVSPVPFTGTIVGHPIRFRGYFVAGYNGTFAVATISPDLKTIQVTNPALGLPPDTSGLGRIESCVIQVINTVANGFVVGNPIDIIGATQPAYDGTYNVFQVISTVLFTVIPSISQCSLSSSGDGTTSLSTGIGVTNTGSLNAADIILALALDPFIGNRTLAEIDVAGIYALAGTGGIIETYFNVINGTNFVTEFCYTFDDLKISFEESLAYVCQAIFCVPYRRGNLLELSFEKKTANSLLLFNHRNKIPKSETRTVTFGTLNDNDGIDLDYVEPNAPNYPNLDTTTTLHFPPSLSAVNPKKITAIGVRNVYQATILGWRLYNKLIAQNTAVQFDATEEVALLVPQDRILVADNTRYDSQDGEVTNQVALLLTLSQPVTFDARFKYTIFLQHPDETVEAISIIAGPLANQVVLGTAPTIPCVIDPAMFARTTYMIVNDSPVRSNAFLLQEKNPKNNKTYEVKAVNYDDLYYAYDFSQTVPLPIIPPPPPGPIPAPNAWTGPMSHSGVEQPHQPANAKWSADYNGLVWYSDIATIGVSVDSACKTAGTKPSQSVDHHFRLFGMDSTGATVKTYNVDPWPFCSLQYDNPNGSLGYNQTLPYQVHCFRYAGVNYIAFMTDMQYQGSPSPIAMNYLEIIRTDTMVSVQKYALTTTDNLSGAYTGYVYKNIAPRQLWFSVDTINGVVYLLEQGITQSGLTIVNDWGSIYGFGINSNVQTRNMIFYGTGASATNLFNMMLIDNNTSDLILVRQQGDIHKYHITGVTTLNTTPAVTTGLVAPAHFTGAQQFTLTNCGAAQRGSIDQLNDCFYVEAPVVSGNYALRMIQSSTLTVLRDVIPYIEWTTGSTTRPATYDIFTWAVRSKAGRPSIVMAPINDYPVSGQYAFFDLVTDGSFTFTQYIIPSSPGYTGAFGSTNHNAVSFDMAPGITYDVVGLDNNASTYQILLD